MKITKLTIFRYRIPLRREFRTSISALNSREGLILVGESDNQLTGYGEAAPYPGISDESPDALVSLISRLSSVLVGMEIPTSPDLLRVAVSKIATELSIPPSLGFALETMFFDLAAKAADMPLSRWWNRHAASRVPVNALIPRDDLEFETGVRSKLSQGFKTFKLKVGGGALDTDLERIARLREIAGTDAALRLDANRSLNYRDALEFLRSVSRFNIEYIEEPLLESDLAKLPELAQGTGVSTALDETVRKMERIEDLLASGAVSAVVLKPTMIGGIARCLEMAQLCAKYGTRVVVTSTLESGVGVVACLHLAAILGDQVLPCGLDTLDLLEDTLVSEKLVPSDGYLDVADYAGLGVTMTRPRTGDLVQLEC